MGPMPGCGMHSRPKLADKARYNSLLKIKSTTTTTKLRKLFFLYVHAQQFVLVIKISVVTYRCEDSNHNKRIIQGLYCADYSSQTEHNYGM